MPTFVPPIKRSGFNYSNIKQHIVPNYNPKVAKSHGLAVRLTDFDVVSRSHGKSNLSHGFFNFLSNSPKYCQL